MKVVPRIYYDLNYLFSTSVENWFENDKNLRIKLRHDSGYIFSEGYPILIMIYPVDISMVRFNSNDLFWIQSKFLLFGLHTWRYVDLDKII